MLLLQNSEKLSELSLQRAKITVSNTAMLRLKDEEAMLEIVVNAIYDYFDEICLFVQPSSDKTALIAQQLSAKHSKIKFFFYPFNSLPNGNTYKLQDPFSVLSRTYFYNWCLFQCQGKSISKWDGDMLPMKSLASSLALAKQGQFVYEKGIDLAKNGEFTTDNIYTGTEVRHFPNLNGLIYINGDKCEKLGVSKDFRGIKSAIQWRKSRTIIREPRYLHFKWCKTDGSETRSWPSDWQSKSHFIKLANKHYRPLAYSLEREEKALINKVCQRLQYE